MGTDVLRQAAALMRDNAEQATPGPWFRHGSEDQSEVRQHRPEFERGRFNQVAACNGWEEQQRDEENAEYIASWSPEVALAVADWLEALARAVERSGVGDHPEALSITGRGFAVANAYLAAEQVSSS